MGAKSGLRGVGARGRRAPLMHPSFVEAAKASVRVEPADAELAIDEPGFERVRALARQYDEECVRTLVKIMHGRCTYLSASGERAGTPPGVRRQAARDLLEIGYGRTAPGAARKPGEAPAGASLEVNILMLSEGASAEPPTLAAMRESVDDAIATYSTETGDDAGTEATTGKPADPPEEVAPTADTLLPGQHDSVAEAPEDAGRTVEAPADAEAAEGPRAPQGLVPDWSP